MKLLKLIASRLGNLPNNGSDRRLYGRPALPSSGYSNWNLSTDRANSARLVLEENGLGRNQIRQVRGFADRNLGRRTSLSTSRTDGSAFS